MVSVLWICKVNNCSSAKGKAPPKNEVLNQRARVICHVTWATRDNSLSLWMKWICRWKMKISFRHYWNLRICKFTHHACSFLLWTSWFRRCPDIYNIFFYKLRDQLLPSIYPWLRNRCLAINNSSLLVSADESCTLCLATARLEHTYFLRYFGPRSGPKDGPT
jgi:hypothetical protein